MSLFDDITLREVRSALLRLYAGSSVYGTSNFKTSPLQTMQEAREELQDAFNYLAMVSVKFDRIEQFLKGVDARDQEDSSQESGPASGALPQGPIC